MNHLEGHLLAAFLRATTPPSLPRTSGLVVSGGHTSLYDGARLRPTTGSSGSTRDDAAGEAFDKGAKLLGPALPGRRRHRPAGAGRGTGGRPLPAGDRQGRPSSTSASPA